MWGSIYGEFHTLNENQGPSRSRPKIRQPTQISGKHTRPKENYTPKKTVAYDA